MSEDISTSTSAFRVAPGECIDEVFGRLNSAKGRVTKECIEKADQAVWRLAQGHKQSKAEVAFKLHIWKLLAETLEEKFPNTLLCLTGSTVNMMGLRGADMDLVLAHLDREEAPQPAEWESDSLDKWVNGKPMGNEVRYMATVVLDRMREVLEAKPFVAELEKIEASVPILRVRLLFPYEGVEIDIGYNRKVGVFNSHLLRYYARFDSRVAPLITVLKLLCKKNGVVNPQNGRLSPYVVTLMAIHYLQCAVAPPILPNLMEVHKKVLGMGRSVAELSYDTKLRIPTFQKNPLKLVELLYGFFNYYGNHFNYREQAISIREARLFSRALISQFRNYRLYVEEPYEELRLPSALLRFIDEVVFDEMVENFKATAKVLLDGMIGPL